MLSLRGRRVLVTGAGGFIGAHLVSALVAEGAVVRAFTRYNARDDRGHLDDLSPDELEHVDVFAGDVRDPALVNEAVAGCEVVFHLAALIGIPYSYSAPRSFLDTNAGGTLNVLDAARLHGVSRVVHTSTSEVYGSAQRARMRESHRLTAQSPYAASKIAADKLAESYHRAFGVPVVTLRPFNTFGPRQSDRAVIPTIISQAEAGERVSLGALHPVRDFVYVEDTVAAFLAAGSADGIDGRTIHIGTGVGTSMAALADRIFGLMGRSARCTVHEDTARRRPDGSEVDRLVCDASKARELLGWTPRCSLEDGLAATIDYVCAHMERYRTERYAT